MSALLTRALAPASTLDATDDETRSDQLPSPPQQQGARRAGVVAGLVRLTGCRRWAWWF